METEKTETAERAVALPRDPFSCRMKICGLRTPEDVSYVNEAGVDYAGFVFAPGKRQVEAETAATLKKELAKGIKAVGVFVDEDWERVLKLLDSGVIDAAQLHGTESEEDVRRLKARTGRTVIKAVKAESLEAVLRWRDSEADFLLLDAGKGDGKTFDWRLADGLKQLRKPFFLAGGLDSGNVRRAMELFRPFGVDVSSGVEADGRKDRAKILAFAECVRSCASASSAGCIKSDKR